jgi:Fe-S-cluster-containing dehydrogenase component
MEKYGLLIDYHYCTGCHTCEVACQQEHNYSSGQFGVTVTEYILKNKDGLSIDYVPFFTDLCNLCLHRVKEGKKPACVKHCLARCITHGPLSQLLPMVEEQPKRVLYSPK